MAKSKVFSTLLLILLVVASSSSYPRPEAAVSNRFYFPHFVTGYDADTMFVISNSSVRDGEVVFTAYDDDGNLIKEGSNSVTITLAAGSQARLKASDLFHISDQSRVTGWVKAECENLLLSAWMLISINGIDGDKLDGLGVSDQSSNRIVFSAVFQNPDTVTGIGLANPNIQAAHVTVRLYSEGRMADVREFQIPGNGHRAWALNELFDSDWAVGHLEIDSDVAIVGMETFNQLHQWSALPMQLPEQASELVLSVPPIDQSFWTAIALANLGDFDLEVTLSARETGIGPVGTPVKRVIRPHAELITLVSDLFSDFPSYGGFITVTADTRFAPLFRAEPSLSGFALVGKQDSRALASFLLTPQTGIDAESGLPGPRLHIQTTNQAFAIIADPHKDDKDKDKDKEKDKEDKDKDKDKEKCKDKDKEQNKDKDKQKDKCKVNQAPTSGNTYYVSNSGSDSNSGTSQSSPWRTVAKVQNFKGNLQPGDSVLFQRGGIWFEQLDLSNVNGSVSARITFSNYGSGALPIIDGGGTVQTNPANCPLSAPCIVGSNVRTYCIGVVSSKISYVTIDGFECRFASNYGIVFDSLLAGSAGIIVQNSYIHDTGDGDYGYHNQLHFGDYRSQADGTKFLNNKVGNCYGHNCIEIQGDLGGPVVQGNECYGWAHTCIDLEYDQGAVVDSNVVHDSLGIQPTPVAFYLESGTNGGASSATNSITWTHNVVYGSGIYAAFQCRQAGTPVNCYVYNNTVYGSMIGVLGNTNAGTPPAVYVKNNILDTPKPGAGSGYIEWDYNDLVQGGSAPTGGSHDTSVNPQYMNRAAHDFHLQANSPVIDKGTNVNLPYTGAAPDLGAFEHTGKR